MIRVLGLEERRDDLPFSRLNHLRSKETTLYLASMRVHVMK